MVLGPKKGIQKQGVENSGKSRPLSRPPENGICDGNYHQKHHFWSAAIAADFFRNFQPPVFEPFFSAPELKGPGNGARGLYEPKVVGNADSDFTLYSLK